jgi:hypothetical protein
VPTAADQLGIALFKEKQKQKKIKYKIANMSLQVSFTMYYK